MTPEQRVLRVGGHVDAMTALMMMAYRACHSGDRNPARVSRRVARRRVRALSRRLPIRVGRYSGENWSGEIHEAPHFGGAVAYRHNNGANVLFFDAHAEWMPYSELRYDPATMSTSTNAPVPELRRWRVSAQ